jgi:hypothetical protein
MICQRCDWILDPYLESVNMPHKSDRYTRCRLSLLPQTLFTRFSPLNEAHTPFLEWRVLEWRAGFNTQQIGLNRVTSP